MIPEKAIQAAHAAICEQSLDDCLDPDWRGKCVKAVEAAAPHMLAGIVARLDENVTALENTLVDEHDYPALCAQREALINVMQMLKEWPGDDGKGVWDK